MSARTPRYIANGNILPTSFVKIDPTTNFGVIQATAITDAVIGVAQQGTYFPPGSQNADGLGAHQNQVIEIYGVGEESLLSITSTVTAGDYLKAGVNGVGVTLVKTFSGTTPAYTGAVALESGVTGDWIRVLVLPQVWPGTSA
jgi:hypothetical protein